MDHTVASSPATSLPDVLAERQRAGRSAADNGRAARLSVGAADALLWSNLLGGARLDGAELLALADLAQLRHLAVGQTVFSRSAEATMLVALRGGEVALGLRTADGVFRTERIVRGPAWLDLSSAWLGGCHAMDAQAMGPASVIDLPCQPLQARLPALPALAPLLLQGLAREVQALTVNTHELMHKDAPARLAQWLHQRCEPLAGAAGQAVVRFADRKRDVASQLAITPETLSRLMRSFTRQGLIEVSGYTVRVLDTDGLARVAEA